MRSWAANAKLPAESAPLFHTQVQLGIIRVLGLSTRAHAYAAHMASIRGAAQGRVAPFLLDTQDECMCVPADRDLRRRVFCSASRYKCRLFRAFEENLAVYERLPLTMDIATTAMRDQARDHVAGRLSYSRVRLAQLPHAYLLPKSKCFDADGQWTCKKTTTMIASLSEPGLAQLPRLCPRWPAVCLRLRAALTSGRSQYDSSQDCDMSLTRQTAGFARARRLLRLLFTSQARIGRS